MAACSDERGVVPDAKRTRRTRFVCISDTHNRNVGLPKGDVLIHAGDLTNMGSYSELSKAVSWLEKADFECKIVIAGNHDKSLEEDLPSTQRSSLDPDGKSIPLLSSSESITYLAHASATIHLASPRGPGTTFKVFGSPYSPRRSTFTAEYTAFQYPVPQDPPGDDDDDGGADATRSLGPYLWDDIPPDTDVLVTHTPPRAHRDRDEDGVHLGCEALRRALGRVRPVLAVCGHVHAARGAEHVAWGSAGAGPGGAGHHAVEEWVDPAPDGKRICRVDLTGQARGSAAETCVVNCAAMTGRYPHRGHTRLNKAIVVDVELPVWE